MKIHNSIYATTSLKDVPSNAVDGQYFIAIVNYYKKPSGKIKKFSLGFPLKITAVMPKKASQKRDGGGIKYKAFVYTSI